MSLLLKCKGSANPFAACARCANVSFKVEEGAIVALIGPNGAGKTTIFNMIAGALGRTTGTILFAGKRDRRPAARSSLRLRHRPHFSDRQTLRRSLGARQRRLSARCTMLRESRRSASVTLQTIIDKLGLGSKRDLPASSLTLPDRKRLEVARALATRPKLLLLDEVMAGLRPDRMRPDWSRFLHEINQREGMTILLIEHVMRAVMALARQSHRAASRRDDRAGFTGASGAQTRRAGMLSRRGLASYERIARSERSRSVSMATPSA